MLQDDQQSPVERCDGAVVPASRGPKWDPSVVLVVRHFTRNSLMDFVGPLREPRLHMQRSLYAVLSHMHALVSELKDHAANLRMLGQQCEELKLMGAWA